MTAPRTIRTATARRIIERIASIDGDRKYSLRPDDDNVWWVTPPPNSEVKNRRAVIIGDTIDGTLTPEGTEAGHDPTIDSWTTLAVVRLVGGTDELLARQEVEDVVGDIRDLFAADPRLVDPEADQPMLGCRDVRVSSMDGPFADWEQGTALVAWAPFQITAQADLRSNPS